MHSPVPATTIHGEGRCLEAGESSSVKMLSGVHRANDARKSNQLLLLTAHQWFCLEERNDLVHQVNPATHDIHQCGVSCAAVVLPDASNPSRPRMRYKISARDTS
jgi:hypothetical protein